jgi:hypothetical protein
MSGDYSPAAVAWQLMVAAALDDGSPEHAAQVDQLLATAETDVLFTACAAVGQGALLLRTLAEERGTTVSQLVAGLGLLMAEEETPRSPRSVAPRVNLDAHAPQYREPDERY